MDYSEKSSRAVLNFIIIIIFLQILLIISKSKDVLSINTKSI